MARTYGRITLVERTSGRLWASRAGKSRPSLHRPGLALRAALAWPFARLSPWVGAGLRAASRPAHASDAVAHIALTSFDMPIAAKLSPACDPPTWLLETATNSRELIRACAHVTGATVVVLRGLGILTIVLCACGEAGIETKFDPCAPLALVSWDATSEQLAAMRAAEALWRDRGAPAFGLRADTTLRVSFSATSPQYRGRYDDEPGIIYIHKKVVDPELTIVIAHEVGHAFGLLHVSREERISVMNPGNVTIPPTADDQAALAAIWGTCN